MRRQIHFVDHYGNEWSEKIEMFIVENSNGVPIIILRGNDDVRHLKEMKFYDDFSDLKIVIANLCVDNVEFINNLVKNVQIDHSSVSNLKIHNCNALTITNLVHNNYLTDITIKKRCRFVHCINTPNLGKLPELPNCDSLNCDVQHFDLETHHNIYNIWLNY